MRLRWSSGSESQSTTASKSPSKKRVTNSCGVEAEITVYPAPASMRFRMARRAESCPTESKSVAIVASHPRSEGGGCYFSRYDRVLRVSVRCTTEHEDIFSNSRLDSVGTVANRARNLGSSRHSRPAGK